MQWRRRHVKSIREQPPIVCPGCNQPEGLLQGPPEAPL
jgi:hypothetical protein